MLAGFDKEYCETSLDPAVDPIYPDLNNTGGYNSSDCGLYKPPLVISISYGRAEAAFSEAYARRQCLEYLKLGLRGVSVIVSSGDYGTAQLSNTCVDPGTGKAAANSSAGLFAPTFPASCPWVTAVGGTQLVPSNETWSDSIGWGGFPPEVAFSRSNSLQNYSSGGGFSRVFKTPFYQKNAVAKYLEKSEHYVHLQNLSAAGYFNDKGRGFPDISTIASNVIVRTNGAFYLVSGTSASAPIFASMISRINDARLTIGKGPVGFLNPVLYGPGRKAMKDITDGWNDGCGVEKAFLASTAWDAVTGLGSPNFAKLKEIYLNIP
jgi:tripeptidyl-peptidase I